jgi:nicotinamide-nucleotide amidase
LLGDDAPSTIVTTERSSEERRRRLRALGVMVLVVDAGPNGVDLASALSAVARAGIRSVLVEGGARVITSFLAERLADRIAELDRTGVCTLAFLASGIEGLKVRMTVKAGDELEAAAVLDAEEARLRALLGSLVFGVDDVGMEHAVAQLLVERGLTLAVAESLTGGLVAARLVNVPGASGWFRGGVVAYASDVKRSVLDVPDGPVVSAAAARAMATGVQHLLGADVGLGVTGVAGPDGQDGERPGTVFMAVAGLASPRDGGGDMSGVPVLGTGAERVDDGGTGTGPGGDGDGAVVVRVRLPGDRQRVRQFACISLLDLLRRQLLPGSRGVPVRP